MPLRNHHFSDGLAREDAGVMTINDVLFDGVDVQDVRKDKAFQSRGFDYICGKSFVEAKYERYASGNISLEAVSVDRPVLKPGWMFTSETGLLASVIVPSAQVIVAPMANLRVWLAANMDSLDAIAANNKRYCTYTFLAPIRRILTEVPEALFLDFRNRLPAQKKSVLPSGCKSATLAEFQAAMARHPSSQPQPYVEDTTARVVARILSRAKAKSELEAVSGILPPEFRRAAGSAR